MTRIATKDYQIVEVEDRIWTTMYEKWPGMFTPVPEAPQAPVYFHATHEVLRSMIDSLAWIPDPQPEEPKDALMEALVNLQTLVARINHRTIQILQILEARLR